jgi:hypothetical protein
MVVEEDGEKKIKGRWRRRLFQWKEEIITPQLNILSKIFSQDIYN